MAKFNNLLNFDAMTLGNHEFDDGIPGISKCILQRIDLVALSFAFFPSSNIKAIH